MEILLVWIVLCIIVGLIGNERKIGFAGAFIISFVFSPLVGFLFAIISKSKVQMNIEQSMINKLNQPNQTTPAKSPSEQLKELEELKTKNLISEEEYTTLRSKIMAKMMSS